jgi:hypothetical protein
MLSSVIEKQYINAAEIVIENKLFLLSKLELILNKDPFIYWCNRDGTKELRETGELDSVWSWWFHGYEIEFEHTDGRSVRVDFGINGERNVFSCFSVQNILENKPEIWGEFRILIKSISTGFWFNRSIDYGKTQELHNSMVNKGMFVELPSKSESVFTISKTQTQ